MKGADALLQLLAAPALLAVPFRYAFDWFDGVRKERDGAKGLAFVCWYGLQHRPRRLPRWVTFIAAKVRAGLSWRHDRVTPHGPSTKRAVAFIFNSGRVPLKKDDLFRSKPVKLALAGPGQLLDVKIRLESDQTAGLRLTGERALLRKPKNHQTERALTFAYMASGHGLVVDIEYTAHGPVSFSLSGPVSGMKSSIQQNVLFEIDIEDSRRRQRQRRVDAWRLWIGSLMMAGAVTKTALDVLHGGHAASSRDWSYWLAMSLMGIGELMVLFAWYRMKQVKKIPAALRFWESPRKVPSIRIAEQTTVQ